MTGATEGVNAEGVNPVGAGPGRSRRSSGPRSVKRSLATILLGFETIVVFLGAVVTLGLVSVATEPGPVSPLAVVIGGVLLCLSMVALIALLRFRWSYFIGWLLQAVIIATGFVTPAMFFVGALFAAMWTYSMIVGSKIDHTHRDQYKEIK
ncbi:DUF4233 domain-containing protein [Cryobacterium sp. PH29-G1]|uniref:DUF4233 domain-containing protein n=1 Tax=Cryobacterium sp. PH29-G1 TaxID=3046211 RepID=UPI0024B8D6E9|nr:DUF4233 domain-containing protein [Cryobacterium sp. PH29-G1]MDJ0350501.1 DUF4233 domain-containing protein [Cryobacterium sp. PH29-G1]